MNFKRASDSCSIIFISLPSLDFISHFVCYWTQLISTHTICFTRWIKERGIRNPFPFMVAVVCIWVNHWSHQKRERLYWIDRIAPGLAYVDVLGASAEIGCRSNLRPVEKYVSSNDPFGQPQINILIETQLALDWENSTTHLIEAGFGVSLLGVRLLARRSPELKTRFCRWWWWAKSRKLASWIWSIVDSNCEELKIRISWTGLCLIIANRSSSSGSCLWVWCLFSPSNLFG
jgi:hypothetical protein